MPVGYPLRLRAYLTNQLPFIFGGGGDFGLIIMLLACGYIIHHRGKFAQSIPVRPLQAITGTPSIWESFWVSISIPFLRHVKLI